ncbi:MAG TPA: archaeal proteasome endopeptidase complex subunit beta [Methanospirillum sp.]|uniref:archaeal proteasome endopeptidase complex subunit beta n=1 Tax=Methanospirillum sp. TaxID=45200 RepID=UPI002CA4255D|nr:archaeal proteasome endopeptidase complex subunit beta [Methanospirillum sp.]HOJ95525.1 archaeal proteasome endopeptidase complex subunit beta [Methanospirillum sp.]HOL40557.1 archaeal proteasome endopeptidase complex subunit beta [Methanospirillum sp.]HPP78189.1 archaeal proteasome endopeptidase complex subunit beta [Methanospirillum sp.]
MVEQSDTMKGTTTVGIVFDTGVVLASEKRATMGYLISNKTAKKIYQIAPRIGLTTAGGVGDAQQLARLMTVEANLYEVRRGKRISVQAASTLLSNILHGNRMFPFYVQLLIGGVDDTGPVLYSVDAVGGTGKEDGIVATGSGSPMAYGVLEDRYTIGMDERSAIELAIRALRSAIKRDAGSGEGIAVVVITEESYHELSDEEISILTPN